MANIGCKRLITAFQTNKHVLQVKTRSNPISRKYHGHYGYRELNYEPNRPYIQRLMHFNAAIMWCYIYWSFRHNWREIVGEYIWPNRDQWSNEYLGVPDDDFD